MDLAADSSRALRLLHSSHVQAVLVAHDLRVGEGEMTGFELVAELKHRFPALPVVLLSGCESVAEEARHFVDGAFAKNAPLDSLVELMRSLTGLETLSERLVVRSMEIPESMRGPNTMPVCGRLRLE